MSEFLDENGVDWQLKLNIRTLSDLEEDPDIVNGFDIIRMLNGKPDEELAKLENDQKALANVIWRLVVNNDNDSHSNIAFQDGMAGDSFMRGIDAMIQAAINFVPSLQKRKALEAIRKKALAGEKVLEKHLEKMIPIIEKTDMAKLIKDRLSEIATNSQE